MSTFKQITDIVLDMIEADKGRDRMFIKGDQIFRAEWKLPSPLSDLEHMRAVKSTDGFDAIRAGSRVLSSLDPRIKVQPIGDTENSKNKANRMERVLKWNLANASKRRRASIIRDMVMSALRYDEICAKVLFLPWQEKQMEGLKRDVRRIKAAKRYGPFVVEMHNARLVHTRYSSLMPEAVLEASVHPIDEVIDMWGAKAKKLVQVKRDKDMKFVTLYDYIDLNERCVYAYATEHDAQTPPDSKDAIMIVEPEEHDLPFLPWVCRVGGTTLESDPEHQRLPLLYSIIQSGQWDTQNVMDSLAYSEAIAYASAPRLHIAGPNPDAVEVDYGDVNKPIETNQFTTVTPLVPPTPDVNLMTLADRNRSAMGKSTVSSILQGGDVPAGTAYATLNLATLTAIGALKPHKELAELGLSDLLTNMCLWVEYTGETISAYGDAGEKYEIAPEDIDPENLYISVELRPDAPSDQQQRINAASMAIERMGLSRETGLEDIGITDPQGEIKKSMYEQLQQYQLQKYIQEDQMKMQMAAAQMQQQMQMEAMAAQGVQQPQPGTPPGYPGVGGPGVNPAEGGVPPAESQPGGTREAQVGVSRTGEPAQGL